MRDRVPFKGRESRDFQAAAQKRTTQNERVAKASEAIKAAFVKQRHGEVAPDEIYGGGPPAEAEDEPTGS